LRDLAQNENLHIRLFGLDLRGLAALRICCGALMLADLWLRSYDVTAFYTGRGIMPMSIYTYQKAYVRDPKCARVYGGYMV
jgi:hypothetical protein